MVQPKFFLTKVGSWWRPVAIKGVNHRATLSLSTSVRFINSKRPRNGLLQYSCRPLQEGCLNCATAYSCYCIPNTHTQVLLHTQYPYTSAIAYPIPIHKCYYIPNTQWVLPIHKCYCIPNTHTQVLLHTQYPMGITHTQVLLHSQHPYRSATAYPYIRMLESRYAKVVLAHCNINSSVKYLQL